MKRRYQKCITCLKHKDPRGFDNSDECKSCRKAKRDIKFSIGEYLYRWRRA